MKKEEEEVGKGRSQETNESNPRRAATKLKEMQLHVEMMRNRFKVIEGHDRYQRYKTIDQQRKIQLHNSIHQRLSKEKEELKLSLEKIGQTKDIREKNRQLRNQISDRLRQARKSLMEEKLERSQLINEQELNNAKRIKQLRKKDWSQNCQKKRQVLEEQEKKRDAIKKYYQSKTISTILSKSKDSVTLNQQAKSLHKQYEQMIEMQKKLLQENNRSLQASRIIKSRFNDLMLSRRNHSSKLPDIRQTANGAKTANSELLSQ